MPRSVIEGGWYNYHIYSKAGMMKHIMCYYWLELSYPLEIIQCLPPKIGEQA